MVNKKCVLIVVVLLSLLMALPIVSGCAGGGAPEKEKVVRYLSIADYTGPIAGLNVPADMGIADYFKYVNDKGGIDGVKVEFIAVDTRYDVARGVSAYKRYRSEPRLLLINIIASGTAEALTPLVEKDKLVGLNPHEGRVVARKGRLFNWSVVYQDAFGFAVDWMAKDWKAKGNPGMPTVGYMQWDNAYGRSGLEGGQEYAEKVGVKLLPPEFFPAGSLSHNVWLDRLAKGGANYIYIGGIDPNPTLLLKDAYAMGLMKTIQFVADWWGPTDTVGIKLHPEATENCCVVSWFLRDNEARENPLAKELWTKYRTQPISEMNCTYIATAASWGITYEAAVKAALKKVGYEKLDAEAMYQAMCNSVTGLDKKGIMGPCTYTATERRGSDLGKMYRVTKGHSVAITDWVKFPDTVSLHKFE